LGLVPLAIGIAACMALLAPGGAAAAVVNGGFESGNLNGWQVHRTMEAGDWFAYTGTSEAIAKNRNSPLPQAPPEGAYAAIADEANPDTLILYQDVALPAGKREKLSLLAYFNSLQPIAVPATGTLSVDAETLLAEPNQQYRIDVIRPEAPLESVDPADILSTVFRAAPGSRKLVPTRLTADLGAFAGQTVRLRFAVAAHEDLLAAGVDSVVISSDPPSGPPAPSRFSLGKVKLNRKNGTAKLPVKLPGAGVLKAKDASKAKKSPKLIKAVSVNAAKAGTATLQLKPTPSALATLRQKHKLRVKVAVTFVPKTGAQQTATVPVTLKLEAPRRR
jgi:hypothetical protein